MTTIPLVHETLTAAKSVGCLLVGDVKAAGKTWEDYAERSIITGGTIAIVAALAGDGKTAKKYGKGVAHATGDMLVTSKCIPGLHEVGVLGEMLGSTLAGDPEECKEHLQKYEKESLIVNVIKGNGSEALKISGKAVLEVGTTAVVIYTAGFAGAISTPVAVGYTAMNGASMGGLNYMGSSVIDDRKMCVKDFACAMTGGAASGAMAGYTARQITKSDPIYQARKAEESVRMVKKIKADHAQRVDRRKAQYVRRVKKYGGELDSQNIRYSQKSMNLQSEASLEMVTDMGENGYNFKYPIDVVETSNGKYISVDNRRLYSAQIHKINADVVIHPPTQLLPASMDGRFKGCTTWGEAVAQRCGKNKIPGGSSNYPRAKTSVGISKILENLSKKEHFGNNNKI